MCAISIMVFSSCGNEFASYRPIDNIHNLEGRKIGVVMAWPSDMLLSSRDGKDLTLLRYDTHADMLMALCFKHIDAMCVDNATWKIIESVQPGLRKIDEPLAKINYVTYLRPDDVELLSQVNEYISEIKQTGEIDYYNDKLNSFDGENYEWPEGLKQTGTGPLLRLTYTSDFFPYSFTTSDGQAQGIEMEFWINFANKYNYRLELYGTTEEGAIYGIEYGTYDIAVAAISDVYAAEAESDGFLVTDSYMSENEYLIEIGNEEALTQGEEFDF